MSAVGRKSAAAWFRSRPTYTSRSTNERPGNTNVRIALLAADPSDIKHERSGTGTDYDNAKLTHPIVASSHIGFTCRSCSEVKRIAEMAKEEGILEHGPTEEGWPGGYCVYITDPSGHSIEFSYNQEAGYNAIFDPVCDLESFKNTYKDGEEKWDK